MCWAGVCSQKILPEEMAWGLRLGVRGRSEGGAGSKALQPGGHSESKENIQKNRDDMWTTVVKA